MSSTAISLADTALQARIRDKLNHENIKLWTEPFYLAATKTIIDSEVLALASRYALEFEYVEAEVAECLFTLQRNAIEKVAERDHFKSTGLATIRIRFSGQHRLSGNVERIQVNLKEVTGRDLKQRIGELISLHENNLKLICSGRVIADIPILEFQNIKNGSQIMVLTVTSDQEAFQKGEDQFRQLEETRGAADYLAGRNNSDNFALQIADQHGKSLNLPEHERKALAIALALHEKGKKALKLEEFSKALVFLLEADSAYSQCQANILEAVDNYGLLNLDIAWCYLSLQSISELPAVEARLSKCEKSLQRSYGENMERVVALKGSTGWEAALFVRLHLLQAISAYHMGQVEKSKFFLAKVEEEIRRLTVSDDQLAQLINMGYGTDESRLALRATSGNVAASVDWIIRTREEKKSIRKQEALEEHQRRIERKLGTCQNGEPVDYLFWRNLKEMGYNPAIARAALKRTNNDLNEAIQLITDPVFVASVIAELPSRIAPTPASADPTSQPQSSTPDNPAPSSSSTYSSTEPELAAAEANEFMDLPIETVSEEQLMREQAEAEKSHKAYDALSKDICSEADYIDLALSAETNYLIQYKTLLQM